MHFNSLILTTLLAITASARSPDCYNHPGPLQRYGNYDVLSHEQCSDLCDQQGYTLAGSMNGNQCWCGRAYPPENNKIPASGCDLPCSGFPDEKCGGQGFWSIWSLRAPSASSLIPTATPAFGFRA